MTRELIDMGGVPIGEFPSTFIIFPNCGNLALIVDSDVDDFVLAGDETMHSTFWHVLGKRVLIDDIGDLGRFLGRHHTTGEVRRSRAVRL